MVLFNTPIFTEGVLPFLLVFVLVFAVLQKTKLLGEGKSQVDALLSLSIALILIATPTPRSYIVQLMPWLAVALVVLLIFFLLYGFASNNAQGIIIEDWVKNAILWGAILFVAILVMVVTGVWEHRQEWVIDNGLLSNGLIVLAIGVALWVALRKDSPVRPAGH